MILILLCLVFILLVCGVPVAVSLAAPSIIYILMTGDVPSHVVVHRMVNGVDSFPLLAVPFFILAGNLMNAANITDRIFGFARALVGWLPGGLAHVNVGSSIIFAGMSGAAVADAGGLGTIEIKAMQDAGYDTEFSVGVTASSSTIGPIIPPSLPMVVYGVLASASIGQLFAAGFMPGLLMGLSLMIIIAWQSKKKGYGRDTTFSWPMLWLGFRRAFLSLLTPVIIIGGIMTGIFTPTEAAIAAVFYALILGLVIYRTLTWKNLVRISMETAETTAIIMLIVAGASIFSWILTSSQITEKLAGLILSFTSSKLVIILLITAIILVVGCFMETIAAITILVPVLLPIAMKVGMDPVHFGVILVLNLMLGLLTPPVGMVLYVLSRVANIPFERCVAGTFPLVIPLAIVLLLITFIPDLCMWLPELIYR